MGESGVEQLCSYTLLQIYCSFFSRHHNIRRIKLGSSAFPLLLLHLEYLQSLVSSTKV